MSLRWVQVEGAFVEGPAPSDAAAALGLTEDEVIGKTVRAWGWSLEHARPTGLVLGSGAIQAIERAAHWQGLPGAFVRALPGVFDVQATGVQFTGWLERYGPYLRRLEQDAERKRLKRTSARTSMETSAGSPPGHPPGQSEDVAKTAPDVCADIHQESLSSSSSLISVVSSSRDLPTPLPIERAGEKFGPQLPVPVPALPKDRSASGPAYFAWVQNERVEAGFAVEKPPPIAALGKWFSEAMMELGSDVDRLDATLAAFVHDSYWRPKNAPFRAFMSEWRSFVPRKAAAR